MLPVFFLGYETVVVAVVLVILTIVFLVVVHDGKQGDKTTDEDKKENEK